MSDAIVPFTLSVPQGELDDLAKRLDLTRWPEAETVDDWSQGVPLAEMKKLVDYWRNSYDWRRCEAQLNGFGQYKTVIDGLEFHFLHIRSKHENAMPLILTHGWPGSILEFMGVIGPLTDPAAHGGTEADAFHLVIPSLPGFGFSERPSATGWRCERIADAWGMLMKRLGYDRWFAQGGDWGAVVTHRIAQQNVPGCVGVHFNMMVAPPPAEALANPSPEEQAILAKLAHYEAVDSGYMKQQITKPQTIGYGLVDSPVLQAAWIFEKMWAWTDNKGSPYDALSIDRILDNITLYWLTGTGASSGRLYWQSADAMNTDPVTLPAALSGFPKEILWAARSWLGHMSNIVYWNEVEAGGHFAAWEQPEIFTRELRKAFALMK